MNAYYQTSLSVELGFEQNPDRPFSLHSENLFNAKCSAPHRHPRAQLTYCDTGVMQVKAGRQIWLVTPLQAVWVPGDVEHQMFFPQYATINSIYFDSSLTEKVPSGSFAFDVTSFFKSLMLRIMAEKSLSELTVQQQRLMAVLLDELVHIKPTLAYVPLSAEPRLQTVLEKIQEDATYRLPVEYFASQSGMSTRTLARLFAKELGTTFTEWRNKLRLIEAVRRRNDKQSVKEIAYDLGYESPGSFIYAFKKCFGKTPGTI